MRYDQIRPILERKKPKVSVEIGTHKGKRAQMIAHHSGMYYGFDLWELGDEANDKAEYNGKGRSTRKEAAERLKGYPHELIQGNTLETLPEFIKRGILVDFAFVDGGHAKPTIASDWAFLSQILAPGAIVIFDDYYIPESPLYGCNEVVKQMPHVLLPDTDTTQDGWKCHLVKVEWPATPVVERMAA